MLPRIWSATIYYASLSNGTIDMRERHTEPDILGRRGAAAAAAFFVSAPVFFLLWMRIASAMDAPHLSWHVPATATVVCTVLAYLLPEKMIDAVGHLIGVLFIGWY